MFGTGNLGDEAMLVGARETLGKKRTLAWQDFPNRPLLNQLVRRRRHRHLLVAGGTLIHGGRTGWLDYVESRAREGARLSFFGTGIAFTPEQVHNRSESFVRWGCLLRQADHVFLRGPLSVKTANIMGAKADIFGDFALLLHNSSLILSDHTKRQGKIGLNFGSCLGDQEAFEKESAEIVRVLAPNHDLVFHVVNACDLPVTERIIAASGMNIGSCNIEFHYYDPINFMRSIHRYKAFFGMRLHAAGLAITAGVPTLMVAYKPKAYDFMAPLNGDSLLVDLPMKAEECLARLEAIITNSDGGTRHAEVLEIATSQKERLCRAYCVAP